jgi:hypothetical protein
LEREALPWRKRKKLLNLNPTSILLLLSRESNFPSPQALFFSWFQRVKNFKFLSPFKGEL